MKIQALIKCLEDYNRDAFADLEGQHDLPSSSNQTPAAREYPSKKLGGSLVGAKSIGDFEGWNGTDRIARASMEPWIDFPAAARAVRRVAVGAVIDGQENAVGATDDLPVVLTVDMNHGWRHRPGGNPASLPEMFVDAGLRQAAGSTVTALRRSGCTRHELDPEGCHLVAAGFFPWITTQPWAAVTRDAYGEELLQRYFGWRNPLEFVAGLVRALHAACRDLDWRDGLTHIIFHGAPGAVTRAGLATAGQLTRDPKSPGTTVPLHRTDRPMGDWAHPDYGRLMGPDVILCDDLTDPPSGGKAERAVWLWQRSLKGEPDEVMNEDW